MKNTISSKLSTPKIVGASVTLVILLGLSGAFYTIDEGERGVQLRNGKVTRVAEPGLNFKIPFFDDVRIISVRQSKLSIKNMEAYSNDQQPANLNISVNWSVKPELTDKVYSEYGTLQNVQSRLIEPATFEIVKNVFGKFSAAKSIQNRDEFSAAVNTAMRELMGKEPAITIQGVQIEEVGFSPAYEQSIEQRMTAEVQIQTQRQKLESERINAQIAVTQAKGRADSVIAEAQAKAEATRVQGEAEAAVIELRAAALASNPALIDLIAAEKWDGKLPSTMVPGGAVPFVSVDKKSTIVDTQGLPPPSK